MSEKKSSRLFITDIARDGRGVSKTESELAPGMRRFFLCLKNNIGKLLSVNIMMVIGNFPLLFIIIALAGYTQENYLLPHSGFLQNLLPHITASGQLGPLEMSQIAIEGMMHNTLAPTVLTYVFFGIGALALLMRSYFKKKGGDGFSPAKAGTLLPLFAAFTIISAVISAIVVTLCNTVPLYVDFKVFGWSNENPLLWSALSARFLSGMLTSTILGFVVPLVVVPTAKALERMKKPYLWKK